MRSSVIIGMIMLLKAYLKSLYSISEEWVFIFPSYLTGIDLFNRKCSKFVMGKKTAVGDKPANKRHEKPISWERLPFATTPLLTEDDISDQKNRVSWLNFPFPYFIHVLDQHKIVPGHLE
jgi:cohesin loading factor subunit SCC2